VILVLNVGSTSVKYELFDALESVTEGAVADIDEAESRVWQTAGGATIEATERVADHTEAVEIALTALTERENAVLSDVIDIDAVGHRVVHGGPLSESRVIDDGVKETIREYVPIAPLHNPVNLAGIEATEAVLSDVPQVAVFDTAFHQSMPPRAYLYGLPYEYYEEYDVRRYGFHGISHQYVSREAAAMLERPIEETSLITCHLGGGCSMAAIDGGRSVDTTMGFSPLEGLLMATRTGDLDPTVVQYLVDEEGMTLEEVFEVLNHESGLAGLSGIGEDVRDLLAAREAGDERAALAVDVFTYRIAKYVGAYTAILDDVDGLVFTAGIGENASKIREGICEAPGLGIDLDDERNRATQGEPALISADGSEVPVLVVPTDEELMIARETAALVDTD
jgi:acetate kinase